MAHSTLSVTQLFDESHEEQSPSEACINRILAFSQSLQGYPTKEIGKTLIHAN